MSGTSNPTRVYNRRKQHSNLAGQTSGNTKVSDGYHSVVSSEGNSVTTKDHTASEVVHERNVTNVLPQKDLRLEEPVRSDKQEHLDTCCLNDSCSSSRSNLDLDTVRSKNDADDLGECSSSGDLPEERFRDKISERSISRDCASAQGTDVISDNCLRRSSKICKHPDIISRIATCNNCKDTFHPPCCNSHFKEIPEIDWLCESCMKTKESLREKSPGRVDDASPLLANACKESTSEDESQGNTSEGATSGDESQGNEATSGDESQENASGEATCEDGSKEKASAESSSEDKSEENSSAESSSDDEIEGTVIRDSRSEQKREGNASRQTTSEGEILGNVRTDSASEDELEDSRDTDSLSEDDMGLITHMLEDKKPFKSNVRVGSEFQAVVPEWNGPVIDETYSAGEPLEISVVENLHDSHRKRPLMISSIGNWLQCREIVDRSREEVEETICGKWRRAPLFEVQTDEFECFDCILWDPYHADCAVAQELDTDEVMKQLKYIEMLRPRLAVKRRKLNHCKKVVPQQPTKE